MPNLASVLKAEVSRLARKELRREVEGLRKTGAAQRAEIGALKQRLADLDRQVKALSKVALAEGQGRSAASKDAASADASGMRFRAAGMASNRKRLGLSAEDFGLLVGASGQSVYQWEQGKAKPSPRFLTAIAALRGVGKKEVAERLAHLRASA